MGDNISKETVKNPALVVTGDVPRTYAITPNHAAEITIAGLALLYFNNSSSCAELGFINQEGHPFLMTVNDEEIPIDPGSVIIINGRNPGIGSVYHSNISPLSFTHIVDLNIIHGEELNINPSYQFFAKVLLNNAVFYTMEKSVNEAKLVPKNGVNMFDLNRIGKVGGAKIYDANLTIEINGEPVDLASFTQPPYEILFSYQCVKRGAGRVSDFDLIYNALDTSNCTNKNIYDLIYDGNEPATLPQAVAGYISKTARTAISSLKSDQQNIDYTVSLLKKIEAKSSCEVACQLVAIGTKSLE